MLATVFALTPAVAQAQELITKSLYVSYGVLQALDIHSTTRALNRGGVESNPLMAGAAGNPMGLTIVKAGGAAATIVLAERLRKHNKVAAALLMVGVNSFYAAVVAHNYRAGSR